jgi:hypothetical protein
MHKKQPLQQKFKPRSSQAHWLLELSGIGVFAVLAALIGSEVYLGAAVFGYAWFLPAVVLLAYLAADLASGFVHFLADNFGSEETPILGPNFIGPFRDHHVDPTGITRNNFVDNNGKNCLASVPFMLLVWLFVPAASAAWGYLFGAFFLMVCPAGLLTNQFHKWAHMERPPRWVRRLQVWSLLLSKEHHDVHDESPYDTYYCITVGFRNPLLDKTRFFERSERLIRHAVPGTAPCSAPSATVA